MIITKQAISYFELIPARLNDFSRSGGLWSLSKIRDGRKTSPSLMLEKGLGDELEQAGISLYFLASPCVIY